MSTRHAPKKFNTRPRIALRNSAIYLVFACFVLLLVSKLLSTPDSSRENEFLTVILLQLVVFIIPATIYLRLTRGLDRKSLQLTLPKPEALPLIAVSVVVIISGSLVIGILFGKLKAFSGSFTLYDTFISRADDTLFDRVFLIVAYALLPAISEELIFRGIVRKRCEKFGFIPTLFLSSLFFGMLHFDLAKLPIYLFSGVILTLLSYATRSLVSAIVAHFLYNCFAIFAQSYIYSFYNNAGGPELFTFILTVVFLLSLAIFFTFCSVLYRRYARRDLAETATPQRSIRSSLYALRDLLLLPSSIACILLYVIVIIVNTVKS